jgi:hypothetical protein
MFEEFDLQALRHIPQFAYYFRYSLRHRDFHEVREQGRLLGRMAAKPLYGRLTREGKVDRSSGFNGQVAVIFIPARARTPRAALRALVRTGRSSASHSTHINMFITLPIDQILERFTQLEGH